MTVFDAERKLFQLDTPASSYVIGIDKCGHLVHLYYGAHLPADSDWWSLYDTLTRACCPTYNSTAMNEVGSLDTVPQEFATNGVGDFRVPGVRICGSTGFDAVDGIYVSHRIFAGKKPLPGLPATFGREDEVDTLEITLEDKNSQLEFVLSYSAFRNVDAIARSISVTNCGTAAVYIEKLASMTLDFAGAEFDLFTFPGAWARERSLQRETLPVGERVISSRRGFSSHQMNPFLMLGTPDVTETNGKVYGAALLYSGSFAAEAERDQFDNVRLNFGINPETFRWHLAPQQSFQSPEAVIAFSGGGLEKLTHTFHDLWRSNLIRSPWVRRTRPVLINNWEATYFDFTGEKLLALAENARKSGIEMLVLDDGWFGKRNDDCSGLGDWTPNTGKLGMTLGELAGKINRAGLKFGLWFEPEMVSPDSDLYRSHPGWCIHIPGRPRSLGRNQAVLDMSRQDVQDYLFETMSGLLDSANIEYIKWDANRQITEPGSAALPPEQQGETGHRFVLGTYRLMERLLERYPELLIEGCCGGGGRFDAGMLFYAPQIWCSDDSDAVERLKIQYGTSFCYPCSAAGAHVSACPNHQTGRTVPFAVRAAVAQAGTFGYELDLAQLSEEERNAVPQQIAGFKKIAGLVHSGDYYRLSPAYNSPVTAWSFVAKDRSEFSVTGVIPVNVPNSKYCYIYPRGLDASAVYESDSGISGTGDFLMKTGLRMELPSGDAAVQTWYFKAVKRS